jgi:hypothetical protein
MEGFGREETWVVLGCLDGRWRIYTLIYKWIPWGEDWQGCCSVGQRWLRLRIEEEVREDDGLCMEDWFVWVQGLIWFYGEMVVDLEPQNWNLIFSKLKCQILSIVTWRHITSCYFHNLPGLQHPQFPSKTNKKSPHKNPNNQSLEKKSPNHKPQVSVYIDF